MHLLGGRDVVAHVPFIEAIEAAMASRGPRLIRKVGAVTVIIIHLSIAVTGIQERKEGKWPYGDAIMMGVVLEEEVSTG